MLTWFFHSPLLNQNQAKENADMGFSIPHLLNQNQAKENAGMDFPFPIC
jgi:hypothetical protein